MYRPRDFFKSIIATSSGGGESDVLYPVYLSNSLLVYFRNTVALS